MNLGRGEYGRTRKCGGPPKLTRDDNAGCCCLNPVIRTEVDEVLRLELIRGTNVEGRLGYHFRRLLVETFIEVSAGWIRSRPFVGI